MNTKKKYSESNLTLLTPIYNTNIFYLKEHYRSIKNFPNMKKIYWNDGITCKKTLSILYDKIGKLPNVQIFMNQTNMGQASTIYNLSNLKEIETDYVIRIDADDILHELPKSVNNIFDVLFIKKTAKDVKTLITNGGGPNGSIFKKEIFKDLLKDHNNLKKYLNYINEDVWFLLNLLIPIYQGKNLFNIQNVINKNKITTRNLHKLQVTHNKTVSRYQHRMNTLMLRSLHYNDFITYKKILIETIGYDEIMKKRNEIITY